MLTGRPPLADIDKAEPIARRDAFVMRRIEHELLGTHRNLTSVMFRCLAFTKQEHWADVHARRAALRPTLRVA